MMNASMRQAIGAAVGLIVVGLAYSPSHLHDPERQWAAAAAVLVAVLLVEALSTVRRMLPMPGAAPMTIVAVLVAVGLCVPETDQIPIAALLPVVLVVLELVQRRQVGIEWYAVAAASVGWAGMFGASGRQSALVGALFAWWAVGLLPLVSLVRPVRSTSSSIAVVLVGAVAAIIAARTGGIASTGSAAWIAISITAVASFAIALAISWVETGDRQEKSDISATR